MIKDEILKKLHLVELEILDEVVRVCEENGIQYFLTGGTLLGAVRHKGFIPWDDDIDICMLREDYDKFIKLANEKMSDKFILQCYETDDRTYFPFAKVRKNGTIFNEESVQNYEANKGIYIDIFPLERINNPKSKKLEIDAILIKNIWETLLHKVGAHPKISDCRHPFVSFFMNFKSKKSLEKWQMKILKKQNISEGKYVCCLVGAYDYRKDIFEYDRLFPLKKIEFEGKKYNCFKDADYYLKGLYGDYMKLPPEDERVTHCPVDIDFGE